MDHLRDLSVVNQEPGLSDDVVGTLVSVLTHESESSAHGFAFSIFPVAYSSVVALEGVVVERRVKNAWVLLVSEAGNQIGSFANI